MLKLPSLGELDNGFATANLAAAGLGVRIYLCTAPADMRKGFDSLAAMVLEIVKRSDDLIGFAVLPKR